MRAMRYLHLDVFTDTPFEGNQLAVFPEPDADLSADRMQRIAREMAFSETTFVFPRQHAGDVWMRIFTPASELPMAGHPTIGTTFALALDGAIEAGRPEFVFELGVGPTPVSLEWRENVLAFAWMTQRLPSFGAEIQNRNAFAAAVGLEERDIAELPMESVSSGVPFLFIPVASRAAVDRVSVDRRALTRAFKDAGQVDLPTFFFTTDRTGAIGNETVYSRMLAPAFGIPEDPATGSASGPLGCYLLRHGLVTPNQAQSLVSLQGVAMGRPSRIHISIDSKGGATVQRDASGRPLGETVNTITRVRVGGRAVLVAKGRLLA